MPTIFKYDDAATKRLSADTRKRLAEQIKEDIDDFCVKEFTDKPRAHLGGSVIGHECARHTWYAWRWVKQEVFSGRMYRLFNRGHLEEARFVRWLKGIGCQVWEVEPETNKQFRIHGVQGHYGGSLDGVGIIPYFPDLPMLLEFKTHNTKSFSHLIDKGLIIAKPQHFAQMSAYGKEYGFKYGLYVATNKNDDDIWPEIVELDWNLADQLKRKAEIIITSPEPPPKISMQPAFHTCKYYCTFNEICHHNAPVEKNCRSCSNAIPVENKEWHCKLHGQNIPPDYIKAGCDQHHPIVNGENK